MKKLKRLLIALGVWLGLGLTSAFAQSPCIGVGGVNNINVPGVTCTQEPFVPTFNAIAVGLVPASAATDIACLSGSATRVIRVQLIRVGGTAANTTTPVIIEKRTALDTAGTAYTLATLGPTGNMSSTVADSGVGQLVPTAIASAYTANPTINDLSGGVFDVFSQGVTAITSGSTNNTTLDLNQGRVYYETHTLRGAAQQLCVNLNANTITTGALNVVFRWTESQS